MEENCIIQSELWEKEPFKVPLWWVANSKLTVKTNKKAKPQTQKPRAKSGSMKFLFGRTTQDKNPISEIMHYLIYSYNSNANEIVNTK